MLVQILVIPLVREQKSLQSLSLSSIENQDIEIYIYIYIYIDPLKNVSMGMCTGTLEGFLIPY